MKVQMNFRKEIELESSCTHHGEGFDEYNFAVEVTPEKVELLDSGKLRISAFFSVSSAHTGECLSEHTEFLLSARQGLPPKDKYCLVIERDSSQPLGFEPGGLFNLLMRGRSYFRRMVESGISGFIDDNYLSLHKIFWEFRK